MRRARIAAASLITGILAAATLLPAAGAAAETTRLPGSLTTIAQRTGPLQVAVPAGVVPSALSAVVSADRVVDGASVAVLVNGREAARVPSSLYTQVSVPVTSADVTAEGTLALSLRYDGPAGSTGCEIPPAITLRRLGLDYTGVETPPTTVAGFFPDGASRIDVLIPPDADDDLIAAGLNAVASLSARYGADTPVELATTDVALPSVGAGQRVVVMAAGEDGAEITTSIADTSGVPTLVLTGTGGPLAQAAAALGSDALGLAGSAETGGLASQPLRRPTGLTRTLGELQAGASAPLAAAAGTFEVPLRQDSFGGPVSSMRVHLEGTHSAVPAGISARLDVYVDDTLVDSTGIGADPEINLDVDVPAALIRSAGTLRATISSATASTPTVPTTPGALTVQCSPGLPLELALDTDASTVTATRGLGDVRGFQLFPQVLDGRLPVAIRQDGPTRIDGAIDAARLVSVVQRQADTPLEVTLVDPDDFLDGDRSGLLVGADADDSVSLGAPLTLAGTRSLDTDQAAFEVESDAPFAALQALAQRGRFVLLLGSWAPGDAVAEPSLSHRVTQRVLDDGWARFEGDVLLLDDGAPPFTVDTGAPMATAEPVEEETSSYLAWFALPIIVLMALLALHLGRTLRRRNEEADAGGPLPSPYVRRPASGRAGRAGRDARSAATIEPDDDQHLLGPFRKAPPTGPGTTTADETDSLDPDVADDDRANGPAST